MEGCNGKIVHLSNAITPYGTDFKYTEMLGTGPGLKGVATAAFAAVAQGLIGLTLSLSPTRALAKM